MPHSVDAGANNCAFADSRFSKCSGMGFYLSTDSEVCAMPIVQLDRNMWRSGLGHLGLGTDILHAQCGVC